MGRRLKMQRVKSSGFTLIELMITVGILALIVSIAIPHLIRTRITANEIVAEATLKSISNAFEMYASANAGTYPTAESQLISSDPPYLSRPYKDQIVRGYTYTYSKMEIDDYAVSASPSTPGRTGNKSYQITTGGVLSQL
jgi:prepilin-type N-terminal cleavage/methylation domain-containing protein